MPCRLSFSLSLKPSVELPQSFSLVSKNPSQTFDLLRHRLLHFEGCFQFLVQALSQRFPGTRWQSLEET